MCSASTRGRRLSVMPAGRSIIISIVPGSVVVPLQGSVEVSWVELRLLERFSAHPVRECEFHSFPDIVASDGGPPAKGGDRLCRADDGDIGAVGSDPELDACLHHRIQKDVIDRDRW